MSEKSLKVIAGTPDRPLIISGVEIPCYVLEDETRVFSQRGFFSALGLSRVSVKTEGGSKIPRFAATESINPLIDKDLGVALSSPILFKSPVGGIAHGYPATILPEICKVVLEARRQGVLHRQQQTLAERCQILIEGLATVGVIALVDEATGYQRIREERALAKILEKYIAEELQPWTKTFPIEFYEELCRLKGWPNILSVKRPSVIGKYTNEFVYERLAPGVLKELREKNPRLSKGYRAKKHHQWLTPDLGHPKLKEHLAAVIALMRASPNWNALLRNIQRAFPKFGDQSSLPFEE